MPKKAKTVVPPADDRPSSDEPRDVRALRAKLASALGEKLNRTQQRDLTWWEKSSTDKAIDDWIDAVPKGDYCSLTGRQHKQIDDAARLYDLPLDGPTINLRDALTSLHDFIASNAPRLRSANLDGDVSELEEEKLRQQIAKLQIENDRLLIMLKRDKGESIDRVQLASALAEVVAVLREYGRAFERIGHEARTLYNQMMDSLAVEIESGRLRF